MDRKNKNKQIGEAGRKQTNTKSYTGSKKMVKQSKVGRKQTNKHSKEGKQTNKQSQTGLNQQTNKVGRKKNK